MTNINKNIKEDFIRSFADTEIHQIEEIIYQLLERWKQEQE